MAKTCLVCESKFCAASWGGPAESCDCGLEFDRATWRSSAGDEVNVDQLRREWETQTGRFAPPEPKQEVGSS